MGQSDVTSISQILGVEHTTDLGHNLGNPIIIGWKTKVDFSFIVDKVRSKLSGWKATSPSLVDRITLAQICIMSLPDYVMQTSCVLASICDEVEKISQFHLGFFCGYKKMSFDFMEKNL